MRWLALLILSAIGGFLGSTSAFADTEILDGIAAQVGSNIVLMSEVETLTAPIEQRMRQAAVPDSEIEVMRADALERLIEARLIEDVVARLELSATDAEVDSAIDSIAQETGLTTRQLQESVAGHGLTWEEYRDRIRSEIERNNVLNTIVRSRIRVEPQEVDALYAERYSEQREGGEELHLRHILVVYGEEVGRDRETALAIAEDARKEIAGGTVSFVEVARKISVANPETGGDIAWVHLDDLAGWMRPVVAELQQGQLSEVIELPFGFNLLQLVERRGFQPISLEDARVGLENEIYRRKTEQEYITWMEKLREQTYIERKGTYSPAGGLLSPSS